jgi:hypothetical protein
MALWHWLLGGAAAYLGIKAIGGQAAGSCPAASRTPTVNDTNAILVAFQNASPANLNLGNALNVGFDSATNSIVIQNLGNASKKTVMCWNDVLAKMGQNVQGVPMYSGPTYLMA